MSQVRLESAPAPGASSTILECVNLSVEFKKTKGLRTTRISAVDDVSFQLYQSEVLSLVGESGSGKTTIARCALRLTRPTGGSIRYRGVDVWKLRGNDLKAYRKDVQVVFQDPYESLNPRRDVLQTISLPIRKLAEERDHAVIEERVHKLLGEVGLDPRLVVHRFPHQLSGGERQRVSIARALASEPKVLVADEPITMLDAAQRLSTLSLMMRLKSTRNLTVLMITHDLASAKVTSDRTAVIYQGKLVELGRTENVLSKPHHPYVELILKATPSIRSSLVNPTAIPKMGEQERVERGCVFMPRCAYATDVCGQVMPPLEDKSSGHLAACHHPLNTANEKAK